MTARTLIFIAHLGAIAAVAQSVSSAPPNPTTADRIPVTITRGEAEQASLKNNPRISAERLLALAEGQTVRRERSAELPQIAGNLTAVKAEDASRVSAGQLNSSRLYTHAGAGGTLSQLITDFGRTPSLVATANLRTKARQQGERATEQDVIFATDQAFYRLLSAQSLLEVANQAVATRTNVRDVTSALTASKLKSELDLNIAAADVSQAKLLLLDAENEVQSASASLAALVAAAPDTNFKAVDDTVNVAPPPPELSDTLEKNALSQRPDLLAARLDAQADAKFAHAQSLQHMPSINALVIGGVTPVRPDGVFPQNWYAAAGVNLSVPIFTGFRIRSEAKEAQLRAQAGEKQVANLSNGIARDVRAATLGAQTAFQKIEVAEGYRAQSEQALNLAKTRYQLGLSSIVELSQAQLQSTQAAVAAVDARFGYLLALRSLDYATGSIAP